MLAESGLQTGLHFEAFYAPWISLEDKYYLQKGGQDLRQKVDSTAKNFVQGQKGQKRRGIEAHLGKEATGVHSEEFGCPREENPEALPLAQFKPSPGRARWQSLLGRRTV